MNIGTESETIEFKKSTSETKEGLISIGSILNKHGNGTLYFGVKDSGEICGQQIGSDTLRKLSRDITDNIKPVPFFELNQRHSDNGNSFIEVQFSGQEAPYSVYEKYYQRFADQDRQITATELERLFVSRRKDYSVWENTESDEDISSADETLVKRIIEKGTDSGRIYYPFSDTKTILSKFGLLCKDSDTLNNAGKVLFSGNKPILLKTAVFATETKDTFLKLNHFEGNIFECIDEGISFILSSISWEIKISGKAQRKEIPELPQKAIREIVVNAFAHASYESNTAFCIEVFRDRVCIFSPGSFPIGFIPEDFAENSAEPIMMNPKIANVLFKADEIESFGSGFERTFSACKETNTEYRYENIKNGFRFTFYRKAKKPMTATAKKVYNLIKDNPEITIPELSAIVGKSTKTIYRTIKELKETDMLVREGDNTNGKWIVKN